MSVTGKSGKTLYSKEAPSNNRDNPVNSMGFRGYEIGLKNPDVTRIICVGGSTTYSHNLDYTETYPYLLQQALELKVHHNCCEVINAGQRGMNLPQINELVRMEIVELDPDVVLLMNIQNNFDAPGFWYAQTKNSSVRPSVFNSINNMIIARSALAWVINDIIKNILGTGTQGYFKNFDWAKFSTALMSSDNIWQEKYERNLKTFCHLLKRSNPSINIFFLEEAFNYSLHPSMQKPFQKAIEIFKKVYTANHSTIDISTPINRAAKRGEPVWLAPPIDPTHLSRRGNDILADVISEHLIKKTPVFSPEL